MKIFIIVTIIVFALFKNSNSERVVIPNVPYIQQVEDMDKNVFNGQWACGPTSAAMMVQFHHVQILNDQNMKKGWYVYNPYVGFWDKSGNNYSTISKAVFNGNDFYGAYGYIMTSDGYADQTKIIEYLSNHGLNCELIWGTDFDKIKELIKVGLPIFAHIKGHVDGIKDPFGHFLTIIGYDDDNGQKVIVNDPYGDIKCSEHKYSGHCTHGSGATYDFPTMVYSGLKNKCNIIFDRCTFVYPIGIYNWFPGWRQGSLEPKSQPFLDCYNNYECSVTSIGSDIYGIPWNNGPGGPWVHPWPDGISDINTIYVQDFLNYKTHNPGEDAHWWQLVYNNTDKKVYPVHGAILTYWHANAGYLNFGYPQSYEYKKRDGNNNLIIVQEFNKNGVIHYLGFNTVFGKVFEYSPLAILTFDADKPTDDYSNVNAGFNVDVCKPLNLHADASIPSLYKIAALNNASLSFQSISPASPNISESQINVAWSKGPSAQMFSDAHYLIYRNSQNNTGSASLLDTINDTSYIDSGLKSGTTYYYWAKALLNKQTSAFSEVACATISTKDTLPPPDELSVNSLGYTNVSIKWVGGGDPDRPNFIIYRNTTGNLPIEALDAIGATPNYGFGDKNLQQGTTYYYWVQADTGGVKSVYSNMLQITTKKLNPPARLLLGEVTSIKVTLTWADVPEVQYYKIFRNNILIGNTQNDVTMYVDSTVVPGNFYDFKVACFIDPITSSFSNELSVPVPISHKIISVSSIGNGNTSFTGMDTVIVHDTIAIIAIPDSGFIFSRWQVSDSISVIKGLPDGKFVINGNGTITAMFEKSINLFDNWQWRNPLPQGNDLNQVIWTGTQYVTVGLRGTILTSNDANTWTFRNSGILNSLWSIASNGKQLLAVGSNGIILKSFDGIVWKKQIINDTLKFNKIVWADNQFIVLGNSGIILSSPDGENWNYISSGTDSNLRSLAFNGSDLLIVGHFGNVLISHDATNWSKIIVPGVQHLFDIVWNGSMFVAVGDNGSIITSMDGTSWATVYCPGIYYEYFNVIWADSGFHVVSNVGTIIESVDGINWSQKQIPSSQNLKSIIWDGYKYVICGANGLMFTSLDGDKWDKEIFGTQQHLRAAVNNGSRMVVVGDSGIIISSDDGKSWYQRNSNTTANLNTITWDGKQFIATGIGCNGAKAPIILSADGISWTIIDSLNSSFNFILWADSKYILLSNNDLVYLSDDLSTWKALPTKSSLRYAIYNGSYYIAVGYNGSILQSTDGEIWTPYVSPVTTTLNSISWNGNKYVAVGNQGVVVYSTDGINWTLVTSTIPQSTDLKIVKWINGRFIAAGDGSNNIYTSPDGIQWIPRTSKTNKFINDLILSSNKLFFIGNGGTVLETDSLEYNHIPTLYHLNNQSVTIGNELQFTLFGSILNNNPLKYSITPLIQGVNFDTISGQFSLIPLESQIGTYTLLCKVIDGTLPNLCDSEYVIINVNPALPGKINLITPQKDSTGIPSNQLFIWNKIADSVRHTIMIADDTLFSLNSITINNITDTSQLITNLNKNTEYYWRVYASNNYGTGDWSSTGYFKTEELHVPAQVVLSSPLNGELNLKLTSLFQWFELSGAEKYTLSYAFDSLFTNNVINVQNVKINSTAIYDLIPNQKYFWRVSAINSAGSGTWSSINSFTTITIPKYQIIIHGSDNGIVTPAVDTLICYGDTLITKATSDTGFSFSSWLTIGAISILDSSDNGKFVITGDGTIQPVFSAICHITVDKIFKQTIREDSSLLLTPAMTDGKDIDKKPLKIIAYNGDKYSVNEFEIFPTPNYNGNLVVPIRITNGTDTTSTFSMEISVTPVNDAPIAKEAFSKTLQAGKLWEYQLEAEDIDNDTLVWHSIEPIPSGFSISQNGFIEWTPENADAGKQTIKAVVSDGELSDTVIFETSVEPSVSVVSTGNKTTYIDIAGEKFNAYYDHNSRTVIFVYRNIANVDATVSVYDKVGDLLFKDTKSLSFLKTNEWREFNRWNCKNRHGRTVSEVTVLVFINSVQDRKMQVVKKLIAIRNSQR